MLSSGVGTGTLHLLSFKATQSTVVQLRRVTPHIRFHHEYMYLGFDEAPQHSRVRLWRQRPSFESIKSRTEKDSGQQQSAIGRGCLLAESGAHQMCYVWF